MSPETEGYAYKTLRTSLAAIPARMARAKRLITSSAWGPKTWAPRTRPLAFSSKTLYPAYLLAMRCDEYPSEVSSCFTLLESHQRRPVDPNVAGHATIPHAADPVHGLRGPYQNLLRIASAERTRPAEGTLVHDRHRPPVGAERVRDGAAGRAGSNDHKIEGVSHRRRVVRAYSVMISKPSAAYREMSGCPSRSSRNGMPAS